MYSIETRSSLDGSLKTTHYMKGVTKINNLGWLNNLGCDLLIQRSIPIHELENLGITSLEQKKQLMLARKLASTRKSHKNKLIYFDEEANDYMVYCQVYFGRQRWQLSIEQVRLSSLK